MATVSDTSGKAKQAAINLARQIAQEPVEIVKEAGRQITGQKPPQKEGVRQEFAPEGAATGLRDEKVTPEGIQNQASLDLAKIKALEKEIQQISAQKKAQENQEKANQIQDTSDQSQHAPLIEPSTKTKRGLFGFMGKKKKGSQMQAEKQQQRVERPMSPSG